MIKLNENTFKKKRRNLNMDANKNPTVGESIITLLKHWFSTMNAYGIPKIFRSNTNIILKLMWLSCFIASCSYCVYLLVQLIQNYSGFPTNINQRIIQETPSEFPAVSFCNIKTVNITTNMSLIKNVPPVKQFKSTFEWISSLQYMARVAVFKQKNTTIRKSYGYQLENMLVSCFFNYNPCSLSDFTYFYDPLYGNCYTFNKETPARKVTIPGLAYGLTLELFVGNPSTETFYQFNDGIVVSVDNQTSIPFKEGDVIKVAAGAETDLIINRNFITKLPSPYGNCLSDC